VPPSPASRILVCGDVINDIVVKPRAAVVRGSDTLSVISARPGGSGARDAEFHRGELRRYGVDARIAADQDADTGSIVIMVSPDGERTMFTDRGANVRLRRADLPGFDGVRLLHLTGYTFFSPSPRPVALSLIAGARSRGIAVTVDPGSAAFLALLAPGEFLSWTRGSAICFPNADEAAVLTGAADPVAMAGRLTEHYPVVALKTGGAGCVLAVAGQQPVVVAAEPAEVVDTTGAGDAFCAGFLSRWLAGEPLLEAARFGARTAADAVTRLGGRPRAR
jgi:sugar/nucleoside kinase (ribokinase family)